MYPYRVEPRPSNQQMGNFGSLVDFLALASARELHSPLLTSEFAAAAKDVGAECAPQGRALLQPQQRQEAKKRALQAACGPPIDHATRMAVPSNMAGRGGRTTTLGSGLMLRLSCQSNLCEWRARSQAPPKRSNRTRIL